MSGAPVPCISLSLVSVPWQGWNAVGMLWHSFCSLCATLRLIRLLDGVSGGRGEAAAGLLSSGQLSSAAAAGGGVCRLQQVVPQRSKAWVMCWRRSLSVDRCYSNWNLRCRARSSTPARPRCLALILAPHNSIREAPAERGAVGKYTSFTATQRRSQALRKAGAIGLAFRNLLPAAGRQCGLFRARRRAAAHPDHRRRRGDVRC